MGMFDYLRCDYPLPGDVVGANRLTYQTKDTPMQWLDTYLIKEDGTLWHEEYDIEDRSDPKAEGIERLSGIMTRVNKRLVPMPDFAGLISFYEAYAYPEGGPPTGYEWIQYNAFFNGGKLSEITLAELKPGTQTKEERIAALRESILKVRNET